MPSRLPPPVPAQSQGARAMDVTRRQARHSTWVMLLCWLCGMALLYGLMQKFLAPGQPRVQASGTLLVERGRDGHFRVAGSVNGQPVHFLVDTGASLVGVSEALAQRAGLHGGEVVRFDTANGSRSGRVVLAEEVRVAHLAVQGLRVGTGLGLDNSTEALLGQNFLRHFDLEMRGDHLLIHPRGSD